MANWRDLELLINQHVPAGKVTTYGDVSAYFYRGNRHLNQPVGSMLKGLANHAVMDLTHRVIKDDGSLEPGRAGGVARQQAELQAEGVTFVATGSVNLRSHRATLP